VAGQNVPIHTRVVRFHHLPASEGVLIVGVEPHSPAAEAGLHAGDIVVQLDGQTVVTTTAVQRLMVENAIDRRIEITVWRNGALVDVLAVPRELQGV
jgi:S1-C subfamily serine protease